MCKLWKYLAYTATYVVIIIFICNMLVIGETPSTVKFLVKKLILGFDYAKKSKAEYAKFNRNFYIKTEDNETIGAFLFEPVKINEKTQYFIICHGNCSDRFDANFDRKFDILKNTYNSVFLIIDYRGSGDSTGAFTIDGVNFDILATYNFIKNKYSINKISIVGYSLGAAIALEYGKFSVSKRNENIPHNIFCLAPFVDSNQVCNDNAIYKNFSFVIPSLNRKLKNCFYYDSLENSKAVSSKLIIFHGKNDKLISIDHSRKIYKQTNCILIEDNNSHLSIFNDPNVWRKIFEFNSQ